ncbi:MAG: hypothetical protein A2017_08125 [Lentisphaerae bacterium GWF2_44_16]|nr:MAG: hypothetical protein A2017_08125 [Lentisphaerae bacterium GWF2_44_16]
MKRESKMIQAVQRAAQILRFAAESEDGIRLCDLSRKCMLQRNTVYNLADTLVSEGLLSKTADNKYMTGNLFADLASKHSGGKTLKSLEKYLTELHLKYPDSSIYYSELGDADIMGRFHFAAASPGKITHLEASTLNPYLTVAGVIFHAFAPEEKLSGILMKNPFEYTGLNAWGSMRKFQKCAEEARKNGYSQTKELTPASDLKLGIPVWKAWGELQGAITLHIKNAEHGKTPAKVLRDIFASAGKFNILLKK